MYGNDPNSFQHVRQHIRQHLNQSVQPAFTGQQAQVPSHIVAPNITPYTTAGQVPYNVPFSNPGTMQPRYRHHSSGGQGNGQFNANLLATNVGAPIQGAGAAAGQRPIGFQNDGRQCPPVSSSSHQHPSSSTNFSVFQIQPNRPSSVPLTESQFMPTPFNSQQENVSVSRAWEPPTNLTAPVNSFPPSFSDDRDIIRHMYQPPAPSSVVPPYSGFSNANQHSQAMNHPSLQAQPNSQTPVISAPIMQTATPPIQSQINVPLVAHSSQVSETQAGQNVEMETQHTFPSGEKEVSAAEKNIQNQEGTNKTSKNTKVSSTGNSRQYSVQQTAVSTENVAAPSSHVDAHISSAAADSVTKSRTPSPFADNVVENKRDDNKKNSTNQEIADGVISGSDVSDSKEGSAVPSAEKYCDILETESTKVSRRMLRKRPVPSPSVQNKQNSKGISSASVMVKQEKQKEEAVSKTIPNSSSMPVEDLTLEELVKIKREKYNDTDEKSGSTNMSGQLNPPTRNCTGSTDKKKAVSRTIVDDPIFDDKMNFCFQVQMLNIVTAVGANYVLQTEEEAIKLDLMCYWCNFCDFTTENQEALKLHITEHRFRCQVCDYEAFTRAEVVSHSVISHSDFVDSASLLKYSYLLSDQLDIEKKHFKNGEKRKFSATEEFLEPQTKRLKTEATSPLKMDVKKELPEKQMETKSTSTIDMKKKLQTKFTQTVDMSESQVSDLVLESNTPPSSNEDLSTTPKKKGRVRAIGALASLSPHAPKVQDSGQKIQNYLKGLHLQMPKIQLQRLSDDKTSPSKKEVKKPTDDDNQSRVSRSSVKSDCKDTAKAANSSDQRNLGKITHSQPIIAPLPPVPSNPELCFKCGYCGFSCNQKNALEEHMQGIHSNVSSKSNTSASSLPPKKPSSTEAAKATKEDLTVNDEEGNRNYKCALCSYTNNSTMQVKNHLMSNHKGSVFYCIDMVSVEEQKRQYVFFCHKPTCTFKTKGSHQYIKHSETCTSFLYHPEELDEDEVHMKKSLDFTLSFAKRVAVQPQFIPLATTRMTPAKYVCVHCSYSSDNNTRVKKHIISNHAQKPSIMRDEHAVESRRNIFFCKHCMWETRERSKLKPHLLDKHSDDGNDVSESEWNKLDDIINAEKTDQPTESSPGEKSKEETNKVQNVSKGKDSSEKISEAGKGKKSTDSASNTKAPNPGPKSKVSDSGAKSKTPQSGSKSKSSGRVPDKTNKKLKTDSPKKKADKTKKVTEPVATKAKKATAKKSNTPKQKKRKIDSATTSEIKKSKKDDELPKLTSPKSALSLASSSETDDENLPLYRCPTCGVITYNEEHMKRHITSLHNSKLLIAINIGKKQCEEKEPFSYFCPEDCNFSAGIAGQFFAHAIKSHKYMTNHSYMVTLRNFIKSEDERKKINKFAYKFPESYECLFCSTSVVTKSILKMKQHFKSKHSNDDIIFRDGFAWKLHRKARTYMCNKKNCHFLTADQEEIDLHKLAHNDTHIYECEKCTYFTTDLDDLPTHYFESHQSENIVGMNEFYVTLDESSSVVRKKIE